MSFIFKRDSRAELYRPHLDGELLVVSFMTVAELDRWTLERDWGAPRRRKMEEHLGNFVVYPYNRRMCRKWAEISDEGRRMGRPVGVADAWIAATALLHDMPLVTHNREHFSGISGLDIISEAP